MKKTTASDVIESFESSFMDKQVVPESLEMMWFKKALAYYGTEIEPLEYDYELNEFYSDVDNYTVDILATMMKVYYLERQYDRMNKIASIVSKDISINGTNGLQKYTQEELNSTRETLVHMLNNLKPTAYN